MSEVRLDWLKDKTFVGTDSTNHAIVIAPPDGDGNPGVKPSDLLLLALAACAAVDTVEILRKKRQTLERLEIRVDGTQDENPPWTFRKIHMRFLLQGDRLDARSVEQAIELAEEKYCSVAATIRATAEITRSYEIRPGPGSASA